MSGRVLDRVEIANAALMEVGLRPMWRVDGAGKALIDVVFARRHPRESYKAMMLAGCALDRDPSRRVVCLDCWTDGGREFCITAADALRGLTCGRES